MRKILSMLLVFAMMFGLLACGASKPAQTQAPAPATTAAPTEAAAEVPTQAGLVVDTCILKEADDKMLNTYTVIAVNPEAPFVDADGNSVADVAVNTAGADALIQWFLTQETLDLAANYGFQEYGEYLFYVKDGAPVYTGEIAPATEETKVIRLSTTTSVKDSGLLGYLLPIFESTYGYTVEVQSAGTGKAISAAKFGNADLILVHAKSQEEAFVEEGFARTVDGFEAERISFLLNRRYTVPLLPMFNIFLSCVDLLRTLPVLRRQLPFWMRLQPLRRASIPSSPVATVPAPTPRSCPCGLRLWGSRRSQSPSLPTRSGTSLQTPVWAHVW